jgi:PAS domain S-box-containing protein
MIEQCFRAFVRWSEPHEIVRDSVQRIRAQTLAAICILCLCFFIPFSFIALIINQTLTLNAVILRLLLMIGFALVYVLAQRGQIEFGGRMIILLGWGLMFGVALAHNSSQLTSLRTLDLLVTVTLFSGIVLSRRDTLTAWVLQLIFVLFIPLIRSDLSYVQIISGTFLYNVAVGGALITLIFLYRNSEQQLRTQLEVQTREQESLMRNLPDHIMRVGLDLRIRYANPIAIATIPLSYEQLIGMRITDLPVNSEEHRANRAVWVAHFHRAIETKQTQDMSWGWNQRPGYRYWFDIRFVPELDSAGRVQSVLVVGRDVTEQKRAEESLGVERAFIRKIADTVPLMLYVYDRRVEGAARMVFANPALERFYGTPSGDWSQLTTPQFLEALHPDDLPRWVSYLGRVIAADAQPTPTLEVRMRRADGEYRWLRYWLTLFNDQPSRERGQLLGIAADVTDEKAMQAAMMESERQRAELEAANKLNTLQTQMMIRVADQFRNPLAAVMTATDMLERYHERMSLAAREDRYAQIRAQVGRLTKLLDDMHAVLYASERPAPLAAEMINLEASCAAMLSEVASSFKNVHTIAFSTEGDCRAVSADMMVIRTILEPLLHNAFLYTPSGGNVTLHVAAGERLMLRVRDTGIGITDEDGARIFDPFYRGKNIDERPGLGLGLSIVRDIVVSHHGMIEVSSDAGAGATFTVWLPHHA